MTIGTTVIVSEVNLGTTVYGCYIESISGSTYSYFRNRFVENGTEETHFEQPQVKWKDDFWSGIGTHIKRAYIPYYNINGYALNGVCFKDTGLNPVNTPQAFNWRASQYVEGNQTYNNAKVFNFQRGPTHFFSPFYGDRTSVPTTHHIQVTDTQLICDGNSHTFAHCDPCVICYVIKSEDAVVNNGRGVKIYFRQSDTGLSNTEDQTGITWYYNARGYQPTTYTRQLLLQGNDSGWTYYSIDKVHIYKIKPGANLTVNIFSNWESSSYVEEITPSDPLYALYNDIVEVGGDSYSRIISFTGKSSQTGQPWINNHDGVWYQQSAWTYDRSDAWIADKSGSGGSSASDGTQGWTGTFRLGINFSFPLIGKQYMHQSSINWSASAYISATTNTCGVSLYGVINHDLAGIWKPDVLLNFLDKSNTKINNYYTSAITPNGVARPVFYGGVFLETTNMVNSNYIVLCCWDCS